MRRPLTAALLGLLSGLAAAQQSDVTIRTSADEVLLDLIVRDSRGRMVRDLRAEEVEILEDGVPQKVRAFRLLEASLQRSETGKARGAERAPAAAMPPGAVPVEPGPRLVSILFDRVSSLTGRQHARNAALKFIRDEMTPGTLAGVFFLDVRLLVLQPFTEDRGRLAAAVEQATSGELEQLRQVSTQQELQLRSTVSKGGASGSSLGGGVQGVGPVIGQGAARQAIESFGARRPDQPGATFQLPASAEVGSSPYTQLLAKVLEYEGRHLGQAAERTNLYSLTGFVREQAALPGRKSVLLFSEGMRVPRDDHYLFRAAISEANRANVTFYPVDVRGVAREGVTFEGRNELAYATSASALMILNDMINDFRVFEYSEASLAANSRSALRELAESTGGFLTADSNDFAAPVRRVMQETNTQYLVAYAPADTRFDGRFRSIEVRLRRPGLKVLTRRGYFAVPMLAGHAVFPHEVLMLKAINTTPRPQPFPFQARAMQFRRGELSQCLVVFDVPRRELTLTEDAAARVYKTRVAFMALFRDAEGNVVHKVTRDIPLHVPLDKREAFRAANFVFSTPFQLPAGRYGVEAAVLDGEGARVSVQTSELEVRPPAPLAVSEVLLVRRVEGIDWKPETADPLQYEERIVSPTLSAAWPARPASEFSVFFVLYPNTGAAEHPEVRIEFWRDGRPVSNTSGLVSNAAEIPYLARFRTSDLEPGEYEARVRIIQGGEQTEWKASFRIE